MSGNITLDWAAYYAGQGLRVFPIKPGQKSPPLITDWPKLATSDAATVSAWWALWAQANICVVMGAGLVDIKTDVKPDANGEESLAKWAASSRITLPPTWSFKSSGGGIHRIFRCEGDLPNKVGVLPAVDIRGGSGYAVFPPSLHPSGNLYEWLGCSPADLPSGPAPVPPELFFLLRDDSRAPLDVPAEVIEGSRNDTLFRLACKLRRAGLEEDEMLDALLTVNENRCVPPLEASEIETICRQAAQEYENDPLIQTIRALAKEHPEGGRWSYAELSEACIEKIGVEPFASGKECGKRLADKLAVELRVRDGIVVRWALRLGARGRGVEITF